MPARRDVQSKLATRLAERRIERGMSQRELADASGISIATLQRLERGLVENPPLRYLTNCALVLGCELDDLVEESWRTWLPLARPEPPADPDSLWKPGRFQGEA
jgi:transcriptional regulator with XRE-family HTH domain